MTAILKFTAVVSHVHITEAPYDLPSVRQSRQQNTKKLQLVAEWLIIYPIHGLWQIEKRILQVQSRSNVLKKHNLKPSRYINETLLTTQPTKYRSATLDRISPVFLLYTAGWARL